MNNITPITCHCQVTSVKYNNRDYKIQRDKNRFSYIKVSVGGKRLIIPVIFTEEKNEIFDYIFNYGWRDNPNPKLDELIKKL